MVAFGRAAVAGLLAAAYLTAVGAPRPTRAQARRLAVVAAGVIVGFPLFTSLALVTSEAAHGAVVIAVLPAATALAAVVRAGERPGPAFWLAATAGLLVVLAFVLHEASGALTGADLFLLVGTALCALGYAEGGALARELGGARTISWALAVIAPAHDPGNGRRGRPDRPRRTRRRPGRASPTSPPSPCSSGSSPGTRGWRAAAWPASARSSSASRCSPSCGRRSSSASS